MSTAVFVSTYNAQSITWAALGALWTWLSTVALLLAGGAVLAAVFALVAMIPPTLWLGLVITACFSLATWPRKAVSA